MGPALTDNPRPLSDGRLARIRIEWNRMLVPDINVASMDFRLADPDERVRHRGHPCRTVAVNDGSAVKPEP